MCFTQATTGNHICQRSKTQKICDSSRAFSTAGNISAIVAPWDAIFAACKTTNACARSAANVSNVVILALVNAAACSAARTVPDSPDDKWRLKISNLEISDEYHHKQLEMCRLMVMMFEEDSYFQSSFQEIHRAE